MSAEAVAVVKHVCDALSLTVVVATLASLLPALASVMSILWVGLRIYETKTVQGWLRRNNYRNGK